MFRTPLFHVLLVLNFLCLSGTALSAQSLQGVPLSRAAYAEEPIVAAGSNIRFKKYFLDRVSFVAYCRTGNHTQERISDVAMIDGGCLWAGRRGRNSIDPIDVGRYRIVLVDSASRRVIYSAGYNSLFEEYRNLPEAGTQPDGSQGKEGRFEEVVQIPTPRHTAFLVFQMRDGRNQFCSLASYLVKGHLPSEYLSPNCHNLKEENRDYLELLLSPAPQEGDTLCGTGKRATPVTAGSHSLRTRLRNYVRPLHYSGDPRKNMDLVIVPEGYGPQDSLKMERDKERLAAYAIGKGPFEKHKDHINIWGVNVLGKESGISDPGKNLVVNSAVGSSYGTFGSDRYLMTQQVFKLYHLLEGVPFDHIILMANSETYGGGGIYNYYTMSAVLDMSEWILPHELGHSIGGLADEYVDPDPNFENMIDRSVEPVDPNITTLVDFDKKWKDLVPKGTQIPTPAPLQNLPKAECGQIGVYEGAGYVTHGVYRPVPHCMMRDYHPFCPVCTRHLDKVITSFCK